MPRLCPTISFQLNIPCRGRTPTHRRHQGKRNCEPCNWLAVYKVKYPECADSADECDDVIHLSPIGGPKDRQHKPKQIENCDDAALHEKIEKGVVRLKVRRRLDLGMLDVPWLVGRLLCVH